MLYCQAAMSPCPDQELLTKWRNGDEAAGQDLFARHFERIFRFFQRKCYGEADDLVQSTFLACLKGKEQFKGRSSFRTYLYTIAKHELYRHWRTRMNMEASTDIGHHSIADLATTMASRLNQHQAAQHIRDVMSSLPLEQQTILEMHYWHELDAKALAEVYETSPETMRTRLYRARLALKRALELRSTPVQDLGSFIRAQVEA